MRLIAPSFLAPLLASLCLAGLAGALSGCVAEPEPAACAVNRNCPRDAPWCVRGACAAEPAADPMAADGGAPGASFPPCAVRDATRCAPACDWLVGCVERACSRAVAGNPALLDGVAESCRGQCAVDLFVGDGVCRVAAQDACDDAIEQSRALLGFPVCG